LRIARQREGLVVRHVLFAVILQANTDRAATGLLVDPHPDHFLADAEMAIVHDDALAGRILDVQDALAIIEARGADTVCLI